MKQFLIQIVLIPVLSIFMLTCTDDALFDPTGETGITVSAFVCDTTGWDTSLYKFEY